MHRPFSCPSQHAWWLVAAMTATGRVEREISTSSASGLLRKPIGAVLVCVDWPSDEATGPVQGLLELARALS
jgi:hypothetical protein